MRNALRPPIPIRRCPMALYCGIDLHARSSYVAIVDEQRKRIFKQNLQNDPKLILSFLAP
jgi:hypothetical protein